MTEVKRRTVGNGWTWFEDYAFALKEWSATCPPGRTVQVGMGVFFLGSPRGEKIRFSGTRDFTTVGLGAIHFRVTDGGPPCEVVLYSGKSKDIPIIRAHPQSLASGAQESSQFNFRDPKQAEAAEQINMLFRQLAQSADGGTSTEQLKAQLGELEHQADDLQRQFLELREKRYALRQLFARPEDLNADCDGNRCHSEKKNEVITAGETDVFVHDDQDRGSVIVYCISGEIEVIISTAVWSEFSEYDRKRLKADQSWKRDIGSQSSWFDQTNRVEIVGKADAVYNLDFTSWDN